MKTKLLCLLLLTCPLSTKAEYTPTYLHQLIKSANLIVSGSIIEVGVTSYTLKISSVIKGTYTDSLIIIKKFKNRPDAKRFAPYKAGQEEIVFLARDKQDNYYPIGLGNEGEIPAMNDKIYYRSSYSLHKLTNREYEVYGSVINGFEFQKLQLIKAINSFLANEKAIMDLSQNTDSSKHLNNPVKELMIKEIAGDH